MKRKIRKLVAKETEPVFGFKTGKPDFRFSFNIPSY